jgi:hypothetical protein
LFCVVLRRVQMDEGLHTLAGGDLRRYFADIAALGVRTVAPPIHSLLQMPPTSTATASASHNSTGASGAAAAAAAARPVPSAYALAAREAGLRIVAWTFERSPPMLAGGAGSYYYASVAPFMSSEARILEVGAGGSLLWRVPDVV